MTGLLSYKRLLHCLIALSAMLVFSISAIAAPKLGPSDMNFYSPPSPLPAGNHGDLIWYRPANATPPGAPVSDTWNVLYHSVDTLGATNVVTGTVLIPKAPWNGSGTRPIITYAIGTHGLCQTCAPSIQLENGIDYESSNITAALRAGYALVITDNPGFTNGDTPTYMVGISQAHAALDIIKAAKQIPAIPLDKDTEVAIWGYSQGGQTAAWAGQLQPQYMPELNIVGVAAGGIPADLIAVGNNTDNKVGSGFLLQVLMGLGAQYPEDLPLDSLINVEGQAVMNDIKGMCVFEDLFAFMFVSLSDLIIGNLSLHELVSTYAYDQLTSQKLGGTPIKVPVYMYHGTSDEFIPLEPTLQLKETYCSMGVDTTFAVFPGEHIITQFHAAPYVLSWLSDRFNGRSTHNTCSTFYPRPRPTNNPLDGDFIVTLNTWPLDAKVHLKTLNQDIVMPESSTFSSDANMTTNMMAGTMSVPTFNAPIKIIGIPLKVKLGIINTEPMTGDVVLDGAGQLHINGNIKATIKVTGAGLSFFSIPFNLYTKEPVNFPLNFDGPISSLGDGNLTFTGTTEFPPMKGGIFSSLFTTLMSGPGQTYMFNVSPPEPKLW